MTAAIMVGDYFRAPGVRLLRGRVFDVADGADSTRPAPVVVSETFARRIWRGVDPILGQGLRTVALGSAAGALGAVAVGRLLRAKLYGVGPLDPPSLGATAAVLAGAALLAAWLPARRAARGDPTSALRAE